MRLSPPPPEAFDLFAGGGELGALMRAKDWSATPLGPPELWPQSLKTCVRVVLTSRQPMFVWWGDSLINLYNDAYRSILGGKHPRALGQPAPDVWHEIWDQVGPRAETAMRRNEGTYDEALLLIMERNGYPEETYYTFSYSPVPNDQGGTGGIICANTDETGRIVGERQLALLGALSGRLGEARSAEEACRLAADALSSNRRDLPFALLYLLQSERGVLSLAGASGITPAEPVAPATLRLQDAGPWPVGEAMGRTAPLLMRLDPARFGALPKGAWDRSPAQAALVAVPAQGESGRTLLLIAGLNPCRLFDAAYRNFLGLVAGQIAAGIANAEAYEQERRRAEALAEIDRAKTTFFSNISHEFRTPLTLMLGPLEDVLNDPDPRALTEAHRQRLENAHRNSLRLLRLVNTLLDFSRIEAGRVQAVYRPTDLAALTADLASGFRSAVDRAGLLLEIGCPPLPAPVYVDRDMWEKVVLNLLSNAFKFTFEGGISVTLHAHGQHAVLVVRDSGVGVPPEEVPRLFERFHRIQGQRSRSFEGSGIGLALVHELVRLHGGTISAESEPGRGTTFTVAIPFGTAHLPADRVADDAGPAAAPGRIEAFVEETLRWLPEMDAGGIDLDLANSLSASEALAGSGARRPRVLLADDNADMRDYVRRLLSARYDVTAVPDGHAALAAIGRERPDLVLSDVMMPGLDGFGLLQAIRNSAELRDLPVILLSARAGDEARAEGLDAGADDYLIKPFSARELLARVGANLAMARVRHEAAAALRARTAELETVLETVPVGVWFTYDSEARWIRGNRAAARLLRLDEEANHSLTAPEVERPTHFRVFIGGAEADPRNLPIQRAARGEAVPPLEEELRFEDGTSVTLLVQALPIRDASGRVTGAICAATDITHRKRDEAQLKLLNETLEAQVEQRTAERDRLWELSEDLLVRADYDGRLLRVSPSWTRVLGYSQPELATMRYRDVLHADEREVVAQKLDDMRRTGQPVTFENRVRAADGSWRQIAWVVSPDPTGPLIHGVGRDVTEAKRRETLLRQTEDALRQAQKMEAIGQLTGGIAHDFNNLLMGIAGSLELLRARVAQGRTAELERYVTAATRSVSRASALTHRLLAFGRRQALDPKPTDLNRLVAGLEDLVRRTVGPGIEVRTDLAEDLWPTLCDANQLESALLNLCINARDAMPDGGILTIATRNVSRHMGLEPQARPGDHVSLAVTDTGTGMPPEVLERAFEPFFTTKPLGQGTGLGLSMLYGFVRQSEGDVRIDSKEGLGTTVSIYLPRQDGAAEAEEDGAQEIPAPPSRAAAAGQTVLVVEDEPVVRSLILEVLDELGYAALEAGDGPSGLEILRKNARIDLMVTDVGLPGMNGRQLADAARESRPDLKVLFITGYANHPVMRGGLQDRGMEMIGKPFTLEALAQKIRAMVSPETESAL